LFLKNLKIDNIEIIPRELFPCVERQYNCRSEHKAICNCRLKVMPGLSGLPTLTGSKGNSGKLMAGLQIRQCSERQYNLAKRSHRKVIAAQRR
jgi:hypothetical protein